MFCKVPPSSLGILRVPQLPPPLGHPPLKNPINLERKMIFQNPHDYVPCYSSGVYRLVVAFPTLTFLSSRPNLERKLGCFIKCSGKKTGSRDFDYLLNGFSEKTIILVGIYNQQFQETIILMVFDLQGKGSKNLLSLNWW